MLSFVSELMSLTDSLITHFSPDLIQHTVHKEITSHKLVKLSLMCLATGPFFCYQFQMSDYSCETSKCFLQVVSFPP